MFMSLKFLWHPITASSKRRRAHLHKEIQRLSGIDMPCIINYPVEVSTVVFVLCPLQLYSPHLFENFIWIFLFILSCLVAPRLEELHSYCRPGKLDTSVRAVPCRNCRLIQQNSRCGQKMCKSASAARRALN